MTPENTYKGLTSTMSGRRMQKRIHGQVFIEITREDTYNIFGM